MARRSVAGFTIIELAVALFLIALLFGSLFVPLQTQVETRKIEETEQVLERAREALLGYAVAHGRFPVPRRWGKRGPRTARNRSRNRDVSRAARIPAGGGARPRGFGRTRLRGRRMGNGRQSHSLCSRQPDRGRRREHTGLHARERHARGRHRELERPRAFAAACLCKRPRRLAGRALRHGADARVHGAGRDLVGGPNAATGGTSIDEAQNPNPNGGSADRIFVGRTRSAVAGNEFDDIVTWIPMPILIGRMVAAGQLP